ncbi:MAG: ketopantoate reductase family protein [Anaerolineae bacterium]|nr:ketopantoate reductase family protein [Anaerolineae bacterium]
MTTPLQILIFGAGAIGTYVGGSLALRGHRAVFIERPEVAAQVRAQGLRIEVPGNPPQQADADCVGSVSEALAHGPFDVAIFALKSYDTQAALDGLAPHLAALPPFLCLQNGVENEAALADKLRTENVIAGTVTTAVGRRAAGDIVVERLRGMGVAGDHPLAGRLVDAKQDAGLNARLYPRAADMKWSKLLTNLLANATSAILDMTPAEIFTHPGLYRLEIEQLREALRVMAAQGIRPVDLPGTPVRALAFGVRYLPLFLSRPLLGRAVGGGRGGKMPSFHIDLHSGSGRSEVDYLNGAVVRFGEKVGVPTPVNRLLTETLLALVHGEVSPEEFARRPEKLVNG